MACPSPTSVSYCYYSFLIKKGRGRRRTQRSATCRELVQMTMSLLSPNSALNRSRTAGATSYMKSVVDGGSLFAKWDAMANTQHANQNRDPHRTWRIIRSRAKSHGAPHDSPSGPNQSSHKYRESYRPFIRLLSLLRVLSKWSALWEEEP
jgi:hypothetical protein